MTNSENSSSVENSDSKEILLSSQPLGNGNPLLPQFLVPLGAQSISILQLKIFSPKLIDDFSGTTFEDSPFFDEFHPQISAKTETQKVQCNLETVENRTEAASGTLANPTEVTPSLFNDKGKDNEHSSFDITTKSNPIDIINREHDEVKIPLATQDDEISSTSMEIISELEIKNDFSADSIQRNSELQNSSLPKDINIQTKSQSFTPEITNQVEKGFQNTTFLQESELTAPQISQSGNSNQLQTSLSSEAVDDNNLVKQQATDIINKSQSSKPAEINNQVGEGFKNATFQPESKSTTPQISQSDNSNQLQSSLSSEAVDDNNLVKQQSTDIINKSRSSTSLEITNQAESKLTTPQISQSPNSNQLQPSLSSEAVDDNNLVKQQATNIINKSQSSTSLEINNKAGEGFKNKTFQQESELTAPQISQSPNSNQLQTSLSSEAVDDNNLVKHQATEIINKSQSSTSAQITNQVKEGFQNTTFQAESKSTTPQISQSGNSNQLQPSLSSDAVDDNNLVKQQATDIINKSPSSTAEINHKAGEGFKNKTFQQESELTAPQISQSDNSNQLQASLSSDAVDDNNLVKQQLTDITNANNETSRIQLPISQLTNTIQAQLDNSESELSYKKINAEENIVEINQSAQDNIQPQQYSTNNHQITTSETISTQDYTLNDTQAELTSVNLQRKEESNILPTSSQPKIETQQSIVDKSTIQPSVDNKDIRTEQEIAQVSDTQETTNQFALDTTTQPLSNIQPKSADSLQNTASQQVDIETEYLNKQNQQLPTSSFPSSAIAPELQTDLTIEAASNQYISKKSLEGNTVDLTSVEPNPPQSDVSQTNTFNIQPETSIIQAKVATSNENSSLQVASANIVNKFSLIESIQPASESIQAFTNNEVDLGDILQTAPEKNNPSKTEAFQSRYAKHDTSTSGVSQDKISDNYSSIGTDTNSPPIENTIQRSSVTKESQTNIPTTEDNYSGKGTDTDSLQIENTIQLSSVTEEFQTNIPTTEDNYSDGGTDTDSPSIENTIQHSSVTKESQTNIPTTEDNYSGKGTDTDSLQIENTIQLSSVTEESQNTIPTTEDNYSDGGIDTNSGGGTDTNSLQIENTIQRSSVTEESQTTIPTTEDNYSDEGVDTNSPPIENSIQRSSVTEESQTTIPTTEDNYSDGGVDIDSSQIENTIQLSSVTEESQTIIPTTEDNYSDGGVDTNSPPIENSIQRSSVTEESQTTIPTTEDNYSDGVTDISYSETQSIIQPFSEANISEETINKTIQAKDNENAVYMDDLIENIDTNTDIIQTYLTTDNNIESQNLVENIKDITINNTIQASPDSDTSVSDTETTIQRSVEQTIPQLPTVLQNLTVLDPLTSINSPQLDITSSPTQINQSPAKTIQRKVEKSQLQPTSTVPDALINNASSSGWSDFHDLVKGQTTPTRILRQTISQNNSSNRTIQPKSSENIATVKVSSQSSESKEQNNEVASATDKKALETLAVVVYEQLKQRLRIEQERHGRGYHGRTYG